MIYASLKINLQGFLVFSSDLWGTNNTQNCFNAPEWFNTYVTFIVIEKVRVLNLFIQLKSVLSKCWFTVWMTYYSPVWGEFDFGLTHVRKKIFSIFSKLGIQHYNFTKLENEASYLVSYLFNPIIKCHIKSSGIGTLHWSQIYLYICYTKTFFSHCNDCFRVLHE